MEVTSTAASFWRRCGQQRRVHHFFVVCAVLVCTAEAHEAFALGIHRNCGDQFHRWLWLQDLQWKLGLDIRVDKAVISFWKIQFDVARRGLASVPDLEPVLAAADGD